MVQQLFRANWLNVLFIHLRVDPARLQNRMPLKLDLFEGEAFITLVAFTQSRLRPCIGGALGRIIATPLARHEFFNVRTYVRLGDTRGIFFLAEWVPNRLAALIGPRMYGLPYHLGRLRCCNDCRRRWMSGEVAAAGRTFAYRAWLQSRDVAPAQDGTRDHFFLERYVAFTHRNGIVRRFDVEHEPWPQTRADAELLKTTLLPLSGDWYGDATLVGANYCAGVADVAISAPRAVAHASAMTDQ